MARIDTEDGLRNNNVIKWENFVCTRHREILSRERELEQGNEKRGFSASAIEHPGTRRSATQLVSTERH